MMSIKDLTVAQAIVLVALVAAPIVSAVLVPKDVLPMVTGAGGPIAMLIAALGIQRKDGDQ
jgi:hypothetical protein